MPSVDRLKRQLLELGIITLVTVIVWIGYGVYSALTQPADVQVNKEELRSIPTNFKLEQLERLQERRFLSEEELESFSLSLATLESGQATPTPEPSPEPASPSSAATPSATISITLPSASIP